MFSMVKIAGVLLVCVLCTNNVSAQQLLTEDVVYLKDGTVLRGIVISKMPNPRVKIVTREGNALVYPMQDVRKITREPVRLRPTKNQGTALVISLGVGILADGAGQWYNGDVKKGFIFFGSSVVSNIVIWRTLEDNFRTPSSGGEVPGTPTYGGFNRDPDGDDVFLYIGLLSRFISYAAAAFDAHRSAKWKTRYVSTASPPSSQFGIRLTPVLTPQWKGMFVFAQKTF